VLLPMEMCSWFRSEPWPSRRQPRPQALAFAIEEQLSENLEVLHIGIGVRDRQHRYPMMVVERTRFQALLALLAEQGIDARAVHVDADLVPDDNAFGVRWFGRWLLGGALSARVSLSARGLATLKPGLPGDMHWLDEERDRQGIDEWLLSAGGHPIDLLQGEFRRRRPPLPWRGAAAVALGVLLLTWAFSDARVRFLENETRRLYAQSEQRFRSLYPEQSRIVDLSAQFQALQSRRGQDRDTQVARLARLTEQVIGASNVEVHRQQVELSARIQRAEPGRDTSVATRPLSVQVNDSATAAGLDITEMQVDGDSLRLLVSGDANPLLHWLDQHEREGAVLQSLTLEARNGLLEARVVLGRID